MERSAIGFPLIRTIYTSIMFGQFLSRGVLIQACYRLIPLVTPFRSQVQNDDYINLIGSSAIVRQEAPP